MDIFIALPCSGGKSFIDKKISVSQFRGKGPLWNLAYDVYQEWYLGDRQKGNPARGATDCSSKHETDPPALGRSGNSVRDWYREKKNGDTSSAPMLDGDRSFIPQFYAL
jgi:hypothetical protein